MSFNVGKFRVTTSGFQREDWLLLALAVSHPSDEAGSFRKIHASLWRHHGQPEIQ